MFEQFRLTEVLVQYKQNFVSKLWGEEKYKWEIRERNSIGKNLKHSYYYHP